MSHPRLRSDLQWTLHHFADGLSYSVLDPRNGSSFQLGPAEYALASMLDGATSIQQAADATARLAQQTGEDLAIDEAEAQQIVQWLASTGLVTSGDRVASLPPADHRSRATRWSSITIKMPLGNPRAIVDALHRWFAPLACKHFVIVSLLLIAWALFLVATDLPRWTEALRPLSDPAVWWTVGTVALLLRILHESAHAVVARRFDVAVDEVGILWILLVPLPYLDVTRSWQRNRRRQRIAIAGAGMLAELVVAAMAVLIFTWSRSEWTQHIAATIAVTASAVTLLFNANILMRFDGYHMLVDLIGVPNLYGDAASSLKATAARVILGKSSRRIELPGGALGLFIRIYSVAAALWRVIVIVGLIIAAEHLLGGFGILLALAAIVGLLARTAAALPTWFRGAPSGRSAVGISVCALIIIGLWWLPMPGRQVDAGVAQYREPLLVRAPAGGFVRDVLVRRGDRVQTGDVLARIENVDLEHQTKLVQIQRTEAELKYRQLLADQQLASVAAQWSALTQMDQQLRERKQQLDGLMIRAETDGVIESSEDLETWKGRFVPEGTPLFRIVRESEKEIVMLVDQDERQRWQQDLKQLVHITRPMHRETVTAEVKYVAPRASDRLSESMSPSHRNTLRHRNSLGSHLGGTLAVRSTRDGNSHRLLEPLVEVRLQPSEPDVLRDGQRVWVHSDRKRSTVGRAISRTVMQWLDERVSQHSLLRQWISF